MIVKMNVNTFNDSISNLTNIIQFLTSGYRQMIVKMNVNIFNVAISNLTLTLYYFLLVCINK